jgi:hypothetical protein
LTSSGRITLVSNLIYAYNEFGILSRSYYFVDITKFLEEPIYSILGKLVKNHQFDLEEQQRNAWIREIEILKKELKAGKEKDVRYPSNR